MSAALDRQEQSLADQRCEIETWWRSGKAMCPVSIHVRADDLERQVLEPLRRLILRDAASLDEAVEWFVAGVLGNDGIKDAAAERARLQREMSGIDAKVETLVMGLDPANLPLVNQSLTRLRTRKEELQTDLRRLEADADGVAADVGMGVGARAARRPRRSGPSHASASTSWSRRRRAGATRPRDH